MYSEAVQAHLNALTRTGVTPETIDERTATAHQLITAHAKLAVHIAVKYAWDVESLEDAVGRANIGLVQAVATFDPDAGPFASWAGLHIRSALRNSKQDDLGKNVRKRGRDQLPSTLSADLANEVINSPTQKADRNSLEVAASLATPTEDHADAITLDRLRKRAAEFAGGAGEVFALVVEGYNYSEVGRMRGHTQQYARQSYQNTVAKLRTQMGVS